jgi:predicted ArsR family transcriptional regulator
LDYFFWPFSATVILMSKKAVSPRGKRRFGSRRAEVVEHLRHGVGTVSELARHLRVTDNAVRAHLFALEREGLVRRQGSQPGTRRPHDLYRLTRRAQKLLAQAFEASLNALISAMKQRLSRPLVRKLLKSGGAQLAARFANAGQTLGARVRSAARVLNAVGGSARVERKENGFCIRSQGCPLSAVVCEHAEACLFVEEFLASLIGAPVEEHCSRGKQPRCRFLIADANAATR